MSTSPPTAPSSEPSPTLVLFDGECGLCNGFVDFLLAHDRARRLRFGMLQGETGGRWVAQTGGADSVIVIDGGRPQLRSTGAIVALTRLGGVWRLAAGLRLVPPVVRDAVYATIARHRYRWFGRRAQCRVLTDAERAWFVP